MIDKDMDFFKHNLAKLSNNISTSILGFQKQMSSIVESFVEVPKKLNNIFSKIFKDIDKFGDTAQQYAVIAIDAGWPPHESFDIYEIDYVVEHYKKVSRKQFNELLQNIYIRKFDKKTIGLMLEDWKQKKWLHKRIPILNEVIAAHFEGKFYLSVSGLLPQIEGIITDGCFFYGRVSGKKIDDSIEMLLSSKSKFSFDSAIKKFIIQNLRTEFEYGYAPKSFLSRHAILHGADTDFGTEVNSLKAILIFDYLQDKFGVVTIGKGLRYHLPGCPVVLNQKKKNGLDLKQYELVSLAEKNGKKPCKICKP